MLSRSEAGKKKEGKNSIVKAGDSKTQEVKTIPGTSRIESKRENTTRRGRTAALGRSHRTLQAR